MSVSENAEKSVSRQAIIMRTSALGIAANVAIAAVKIAVGVLASSIAIVSEGVNNASDALTSVLTLIGAKLAGKHPDAKHPFGYGRFEYLSSLVVAALILFTGIEMLRGAVNLIFSPAETKISYISLAVVVFSAALKFLLGIYTIKMGKKASSELLTAVGLDCRNDSFVSIVTILSALIFLVFHLSIDAYAGAFMSLVICKTGFDVLRETVSELLGRPGEKDLAAQIYKEIRATPCIVNAADMMLHNYGPGAYSGSVNVEIDHEKTVGEVYESLHKLQLRIMREHRVTMVFGIYAVDNDHADSKKARETIGAFVKSHENVKNFHAVYIEPESGKIYCDLVVDYDLRDWDALKTEFLEYMKENYPQNPVELTIETEFV